MFRASPTFFPGKVVKSCLNACCQIISFGIFFFVSATLRLQYKTFAKMFLRRKSIKKNIAFKIRSIMRTIPIERLEIAMVMTSTCVKLNFWEKISSKVEFFALFIPTSREMRNSFNNRKISEGMFST